MRWMASAIVRTWASDSMTHGPAIRNRRPAPTCTGPISNDELTSEILSCREAGRRLFGRTTAAPADSSQLHRAISRPLRQRTVQRAQRRGTGQLAVRLHNAAVGQPPAEGQVFFIKADFLTCLSQRFPSLEIEFDV